MGFIDWFDDCLADGYLKLGRLDDAIAEYQRVLARNPNAALARYHLAEACARKDDKSLAREQYQQFLGSVEGRGWGYRGTAGGEGGPGTLAGSVLG